MSTSTTILPKHITEPDPNVYSSNNYIVVDFETTTIGRGLAVYPDNSILLACWSVGKDHPQYSSNPHRSVWAGEYGLSELTEAIEQADFLIAHNAKFELQWLARCGLDLTQVVTFDTMLAEYVIGGNRWVGFQLSLQKCAKRRKLGGKTDVVSKMIKVGIDTRDIPQSWLQYYCEQDVRLTHKLFRDQLKDLTPELMAVTYSRNLLTPVLADVEMDGMQLDIDLVRTRLERVEREYAEAEAALELIAKGVNINSGPQMAEFLYDTLGFDEVKVKKGGRWIEVRTDSGRKSTSADTIGKLKCRNKEQRDFVERYTKARELWNELTKYLRKFDACGEEKGGLLHAMFNQSFTQTHRLSSRGLDYTTQFQNFPRIYKPFFKAKEEGWLVGECDGAQLEFRVAVHLGRDAVGLEDINSGTDVHKVTAGIIGCTRQDAKPHTFKPLYGGQSGTEDEKRYYKFFREKYEDITNTQQRWIDTVLDQKCLKTEWGMTYYWPDTTMDRSGYVRNTTSICNYPVQAFATAEIIPAALVFFWHRVKVEGLRMRIVNTVHDSIIVEIPPEEVKDFHRLSKQCLIDDVYEYVSQVYCIKLTVPLGCGVKVASHWGGSDAADYVPDGLEDDKGEVVYTAREHLVTAM